MKLTVNVKVLLVYLAALIAGIVFASFYGGPVAFAPLFALLLMIPVSGFYIYLCYKALRVFQEVEVHKLTKGEDHKYRAVIENAGFLPIHNLAVGLFKDRCTLYEIPNKLTLSLDIQEKKELSSGINCRFAGAYDVGIENVSFQDPFHIYAVQLDIPYSFRAIVRPRITDIAGRDMDLENLFNSRGQKSAILFEDTPGNDLRPYQKGDSSGLINWKVSARLSKLMVRVPDRMEKRTLSIVMNAENLPERLQDTDFLIRRDYLLEFVVSAASLFGDQGIPLKIVYPAGSIREDNVDSHDSFMDFYNTVSDGIFYSSDAEFNRLTDLIRTLRESKNGDSTWIIITENPKEGENFIDICD